MGSIHRLLLLVIVISVSVMAPLQAGAYSYGDPSKEVIAEAMKGLVAKLNGSPPDWMGAAEIYKVHRPEIESHFGASVAGTLDADIAAKDKERFLSNYKALLALNLERRFKYANQGIEDYSATKLLLAKAKGTYDVLQPYVKDDATNAAVIAAFDEALKALGNPGLFGVGEEPVDPKTFKAKTDFILGVMKPLFQLQAAAPKPAAKEPAPAEQPKQPAKAETPKQEAKKPVAKQEPASAAEPATASEPKAEAAPESETAAAEPAAETAPAEEAAATEEAEPTEAPLATETVAEEPTAEPAEATAVAAPEAHAPMERQDRTNPVVSIIVIGAVALAGAGGIWFAKKRKLF
jgi:hypothetical protein